MIIVTLVLSTLLVSIWFYSSRGQQCCAELRMMIDTGAGQVCPRSAPPSPPAPPFAPPLPPLPPLPPPPPPPALLSPGGVVATSDEALLSDAPGCPPVGPCLGYVGNCADLQEQFATVQGCYFYGDPGAEDYHEFLDEYVCHAFPDDAYVTDQFFVALISVAVALPVDMFLQRAFEIANEVEGAPESWLTWSGIYKMALGKHGHADWHFTDESRKHPSDVAMFVATTQDVSMLEVVAFWLENLGGPMRFIMRVVALAYDVEAWTEVPEMIFAAIMFVPRMLRRFVLWLQGKEQPEEEGSDDGSSEASAATKARRDRLQKRLYASAGLIGVYLCWTIFAWCVRAARLRVARPTAGADAILLRA